MRVTLKRPVCWLLACDWTSARYASLPRTPFAGCQSICESVLAPKELSSMEFSMLGTGTMTTVSVTAYPLQAATSPLRVPETAPIHQYIWLSNILYNTKGNLCFIQDQMCHSLTNKTCKMQISGKGAIFPLLWEGIWFSAWILGTLITTVSLQ
jgi:hypothetical protein